MLLDSQIKAIASTYDIHPAAIKAVINVESTGNGFYTKGNYTGELLVRFEGHWFKRYTKGIYDKSFPSLSFKNWRLGYGYNEGLDEFGRFYEAFKLNREAAWLSSSWGMFQTMGFNYEACGYSSPREMIIDYYKGEEQQLIGFINYCASRGILDDLRRLDWSFFARMYNGSNYKVNEYDVKLEHHFMKWKNNI